MYEENEKLSLTNQYGPVAHACMGLLDTLIVKFSEVTKSTVSYNNYSSPEIYMPTKNSVLVKKLLLCLFVQSTDLLIFLFPGLI